LHLLLLLLLRAADRISTAANHGVSLPHVLSSVLLLHA
jgi:hypothetical protein